jgi:rubrerythrin
MLEDHAVGHAWHQDEYLANARYMRDIEKFVDQRLFSRIAEAEKRHIGLLKPIMVKHEVPVPVDRGTQYVTTPDTLTAALKAAVEGERNNMRMYNIFLKQQLPEDVRFTFTLLRNAAARHLYAFERSLARQEGITTPSGSYAADLRRRK